MPSESDIESGVSNPAKLEGYPPAVRQAYYDYCLKRDEDTLLLVVVSALEFMLPVSPSETLITMPEETRLVEDLGVDSLALTELVFLLEELFDVRITNNELAELRTIGDLKKFSIRKLPTIHTKHDERS